MIITLPYAYRLTGVQPRKRNTTGRTCYDNVMVDVQDIPVEDFNHALTLTDRQGRHLETFYHYDNSFWIADARPDGQTFHEQHLMLFGHFPRKERPPLHHFATPGQRANFRPFSRDEAESWNTRSAEGLRTIGLLRFATTDPQLLKIVDTGGVPQHPFSTGENGIVCDVVRPDWEFRIVESDPREEKALKAATLAQTNTVAVGGVLYHRVPEPVIYASDSKVDWCFSTDMRGTRGSNAADDTIDKSSVDAYRIPMTDESTIAEAFSSLSDTDRVMFQVHFIDERFFEKVDLRKGLVKDVKSVLKMRYDLADQTTAFIAKWCELRDLAHPVGRGLDDLDSHPTEFYDEAASILADMEAAGMGFYPGASMWNNREVGLNIETPSNSL